MSRRPIDPLAGAELVIVDASNLLYALQRGPARLPAAALIGRMRGVIPPTAAVELVFDGPPEPGMRRTQVAAGVEVRYAAPRTADEAVLDRARGFDREARRSVLVVTDDGALRHELDGLGARTARCAWLIARLERGVLSAPSVGNRRPPGADRRASGRSREDSLSRRR